jgi:hypothetical protein
MTELIARKDFLMVMLNEAVLHGRASLTINATFLDIDLLGANLKEGTIDWLASSGDYDRAYTELTTKLGDPSLVREVPPFSDFREALHASLLLPPDNMGELMKEIRSIEQRRDQPSRYPKQSCLAIDTNLAYRRLFSRLGLASEACGVVDFDAAKVQLLVASLVEQEVSEKVGRKYGPTDLDILKRAFNSPKLVSSFNNCVNKDGRKALNAQAELSAIRSKYNVWDVAGGTWSEDKEKRDGEILRALARHAQDERLDLLFVSADDKATAAARSAKVPILVLRYPNEVPRTVTFDPWLFVELMHDLAVTYGVLTVKGLGLRIMGDWAGKTADDFRAEKLKIVTEESSVLADPLLSDQRILERLRRDVELTGLR